MVFLRDRTQLPLAPDGEQPERPLELVVPYTNPSLAAQALSAALELAHGLLQDLQSPGHLQADQSFADAVEHGRYDLDSHIHGWSP